MEYFTEDMEDDTENPAEKRGSKLKSLKTRLLGKMKRKDREPQYSQSASDITVGATLDSNEDMLYSEGMLSSRALSHDSIFHADQCLSNPEPSRVLSQENIPSKIKALQMKLQQQKLHFGPPPLLMPVKRQEDFGGSSEDDGLPHSPPEISVGEASTQGPSYKLLPRNHSSLSLTGTGSEEALSLPFSRPLSPVPTPQPAISLLPIPSLSAPISVLSAAPPATATPALDFGTPALLHSCLDTSAARHRMSIKPRNQRASSKVRMPTAVQVESRPRSESFNNFTRPRSENGNGLAVAKETARQRSQTIQVVRPGQIESNRPNISQTAPSTAINLISTPSLPTEPQTVSKPLNLIPLQRPFRRDQSPLCASNGPHQTPEAKPMPSKPPPTTTNQPEHKGEVTGEVKSSALLAKTETKPSNTPTSAAAPRPSSQVGTSEEAVEPVGANNSASGTPDGEESAKGAQRPAEASGSSRFSINSAKGRSEDRPRSGSLLGVLERAGSGQRREEAIGKVAPSNMSQRAQAPAGVAGTGEAKPTASAVYPPDTTVKKAMEHGTFSKTAVMDKREPEEMNQEKVEEVMIVKEVKEYTKEFKKDEDGKKAFGVTLRNTSLSSKFRADSTANPSIRRVERNSAEVGSLTHQAASLKPTETREQRGNQEPQVAQGNKITQMAKKLPSNIVNTPSTKNSSLRTGPSTQADDLSTQPVSLSDVKLSTSAANMTNITLSPAAESQRTSPALKEAPSTPLPDPLDPQAVPSEVSWMSLALEKTRSLQQLITSRLPREFAGQTTARPQTQPQPTAQMQTATQTVSVKQQNAPQPQTTMQPPAVNAKTPLTQATSQPQPAKQQSLQNLSTTQTQAQTTLQQRIMSHTTNPSEVLTQAPKKGNIQPAQQTTASPTAQINPCNVSFRAIRPSLRSTHSPLRSFPQTETENMSQSSQVSFAQPPDQFQFTTGLQNASLQQSPHRVQGLHSVGQPKPTTSLQAPVSSFTSSLGSAPAGQGEGGVLLTERRAVWAGSVGIRERTATLEKQTEWTPPGNKLELRRNFTTETRASATASPNTTHKESLEGKCTRWPESSPTRVPGKLKDQEDICLRKNTIFSSSPSTCPTPSSPLQSMSDSGQPSWMDMAKRKSMAWSDKTTD